MSTLPFFPNTADPNWKGQKPIGMNALYVASRKGLSSEVETILDEGRIDINASMSDGFTSLMVAGLNGKYDVVKLLLERGADYKMTAKDGKHVLFHAL